MGWDQNFRTSVRYFFAKPIDAIRTFAPGVMFRSLSAMTCFSEPFALAARAFKCVICFRRLRRLLISFSRSLAIVSFPCLEFKVCRYNLGESKNGAFIASIVGSPDVRSHESNRNDSRSIP